MTLNFTFDNAKNSSASSDSAPADNGVAGREDQGVQTPSLSYGRMAVHVIDADPLSKSVEIFW
jgi:hypothetical protein